MSEETPKYPCYWYGAPRECSLEMQGSGACIGPNWAECPFGQNSSKHPKESEGVPRNPYPEDIFSEPTACQLSQLHGALKKSGLTLDQFSGSLGRKIWKTLQVDWLSFLPDEEELTEIMLDDYRKGISLSKTAKSIARRIGKEE